MNFDLKIFYKDFIFNLLKFKYNNFKINFMNKNQGNNYFIIYCFNALYA